MADGIAEMTSGKIERHRPLGGGQRLGPVSDAILSEGERPVPHSVVGPERDGSPGMKERLLIIASGPVGEGSQNQSKAVVGWSVAGILPHGLSKRDHRLPRIPLFVECNTQVCVDTGALGIEPDRSAEFGDRLVQVTLVVQGEAETVMGTGQSGIAPDRRAVCGLGLVK
jgi:hypothetical protein